MCRPKQFLVPDDVVTELIDDELVLLNLSTGIYFGLNKVGTRIWNELCDHGDAELALERVAAAYRTVARETIRNDLQRLLNELQETGLLKPSG